MTWNSFIVENLEVSKLGNLYKKLFKYFIYLNKILNLNICNI